MIAVRPSSRTWPLSRSTALVVVWLFFLTAFYLYIATVNLANYWPVTSDDGWITSASFKWARDGVFGSDLYARFFNAEHHYFIALPTQPILQMLVFKFAGPSVENARWITITCAIILLWAVTWLSWHWHGPLAAFLTGLLLLFWRSNLAGARLIPLLAVSRSARYDLTAVTLIWLSVLLVYRWLKRPTIATALGAGFFAAAATLAQFFGIAALLNLLLLWLWARRRHAVSFASGCWMGLGVALPTVPYLAYILRHWHDAAGQTLYIQGPRAALTPPVLLQNFLREWQRYRPLLPAMEGSIGAWLLVVGLGPALLYLGWRLQRSAGIGDRVLAAATLSTYFVLAVVDTTKATLYAIVLLPCLCLLFGQLFAALLRQSWSQRQPFWRWTASATVTFPLLLVTVQGIDVYQAEYDRAMNITAYEAVGEAIRRELPAGVRVAGSDRWWWALPDHPYLALNGLWLRWQVGDDREAVPPTFAGLVQESDVDFILISKNVRGDLSRRAARLQQEFWAFVERCTVQRASWDDYTYGHITLHEIQLGCEPNP